MPRHLALGGGADPGADAPRGGEGGPGQGANQRRIGVEQGSGRGDVVVGHLMRGQAGQQGKTGGRVQVGGQLGGVLVQRLLIGIGSPCHDPTTRLTT